MSTVCVLVDQLWPALCDPMDCSPSGSPAFHFYHQCSLCHRKIVSLKKPSQEDKLLTPWVESLNFFHDQVHSLTLSALLAGLWQLTKNNSCLRMPITVESPIMSLVFCAWQVLSIYLRIKLKNVKYISVNICQQTYNYIYSIYNTYILRGLLK